jgi:2-(1,2-epoxy-1,2-dihydrophenyl)acetyl-CoA isomerase
MPKPTVAVVNGVAAGAGVSLALACDLRLASSAARWRLAFSGIGLVPDAGSTWHLPRLVGLSRAMEMALLGDWVDADQALQFGLVNRVWPAEDLQPEAEAALSALAAGPTLAFGRAKALFRPPGDRPGRRARRRGRGPGRLPPDQGPPGGRHCLPEKRPELPGA